MVFGTIAKRPELDFPMDNSTANESYAASDYPYLSLNAASMNYNASYSEFGEYHLRSVRSTVSGMRVSNYGGDILDTLANGGSISIFKRVMIEANASSGNTNIHYNYTGSFSGGVYWGHGFVLSINISGGSTGSNLFLQPTPSNLTDSSPTPATGKWYDIGSVGSFDNHLLYFNDAGTSYESEGTPSSPTGVFDGGYTYDGFGQVGPGGVNPIFVGTIRRKNCLQFLCPLTRTDFEILSKNNGRILL